MLSIAVRTWQHNSYVSQRMTLVPCLTIRAAPNIRELKLDIRELDSDLLAQCVGWASGDSNREYNGNRLSLGISRAYTGCCSSLASAKGREDPVPASAVCFAQARAKAPRAILCHLQACLLFLCQLQEKNCLSSSLRTSPTTSKGMTSHSSGNSTDQVLEHSGQGCFDLIVWAQLRALSDSSNHSLE